MRDALKKPIDYVLDSWLQLSTRLWNAFAILGWDQWQDSCTIFAMHSVKLYHKYLR